MLFVLNIALFVLNMTVFVLSMTVFVLNMAVLVLTMTIFVLIASLQNLWNACHEAETIKECSPNEYIINPFGLKYIAMLNYVLANG